jgi:hypothetical protein
MFELALQLQKMGELVEMLIIVDSNPPSCRFQDGFHSAKVRLFHDSSITSRVAGPEAFTLRVAEVHVDARNNYILDLQSEHNCYRGAVTYLYCTANPIVAGHDPRRLWPRLAPANFQLVPLPGLHAVFDQEPQATALIKLLRACLDGSALTTTDDAAVFGPDFSDRERWAG